MKKVLLLLASALMLFAWGCEPEPEKEDPENKDSENVDPKPDPEPEKSTDCLILSFALEAGGLDFEGTIYNEENAVVVEAFPDQLDLFKNVTKVTYTISEKATINPDPATVTDYSTSPTFTVTAEDGKTVKRYTVDVEEAMFVMAMKSRDGQDKPIPVENIGISNEFVKFPGNQVTFVASDLIAVADGNIYDLDLNKKGEICREGIADDMYFAAMANDDNNVLIAAMVSGGELTPGSVTTTIYYAWLDGWDKAPVDIYNKTNQGNKANYMNVVGDARSRMLITACYPEGSAEWTWYFDYDETLGKPQTSGDKWSEFAGPEAGGATSYLYGNSAGKALSPFTADKEGFLVYAVTRGNLSTVDPKFNEHVGVEGVEEDTHWGKDGGAGPQIVYFKGRSEQGPNAQSLVCEELLHLRGAVYPDAYNKLRYGGFWGWGNLAAPANIKAFTLEDKQYVAVGHAGWGKSYLTVVDITASSESEDQGSAPTTNNTAYLLRTQAYDLPGCIVSVAYTPDSSVGGGHIAVIYGHTDIEGSNTSCIQIWDIYKKKI